MTSWGPHSLRRLMAMPQETCRSPPGASWTGPSSPWPTATCCLNFTYLRWLQTHTVWDGNKFDFLMRICFNPHPFHLCSCKGCCQEIQRIWDPGRDDWVVEVPEPRLREGGVHQNLPCREGDPVRLSGCRKTDQISGGMRCSQQIAGTSNCRWVQDLGGGSKWPGIRPLPSFWVNSDTFIPH